MKEYNQFKKSILRPLSKSVKKSFYTKEFSDEVIKTLLKCGEEKWDDFSKSVSEMNYSDFLNSIYWSAISHKIKDYYGWKCALCNSSKSLEVHHRTYEILGKEFLTILTNRDLICLCHDCHNDFHERVNNG